MPGSVLEFGSKKTAAISGRLRAFRACAYRSIALRAARPADSGASPHLYPAFSGTAQACLAFPKSAPRTPEFDTRLHRYRVNQQVLIIMLVIGCLLYTSDAADDLLCVDLGGRRIIKKK